jgi:predicted MFS family arabinose efflux permease
MTTQAQDLPTPDAAQRRLLWALGAAVFMVNLDARVVAPLLPTVASELGVSLARSAWLVSAYMLPYGMCQLMFGPLADRFGKIAVCTYAMLAFSLGTACTALWPSFEAIVTLRALTGATAAGLIPLTLAYIGDTVPYERRQATIGALMATAGAAQALSTSLGGSIAALLSWRAVFPLLGALAFAAALALYVTGQRERRRPKTSGERPVYGDVLRAPGMLPLLVLVASEGFLFMGGFSFLSGWLEERFGLGALAIGFVLSLAGLSQLVTAWRLRRLLARFSERWMLGGGGAALAGAFLLAAVAPHWSVVALGCSLLGVGFICCHTTLQTRATEAYPRGRGTAVALFAFSLFLGSGVGTAALGVLLEAVGFQALFLVVGVLLGAFTVCVVRVLGEFPKSESRTPIPKPDTASRMRC